MAKGGARNRGILAFLNGPRQVKVSLPNRRPAPAAVHPPFLLRHVSDDPNSTPADPAPPAASDRDDSVREISRFPRQKKRHRKVEGGEGDETLAEEDEIALLSSALELARARRKQSAESPRPASPTVNRFVPVTETAPAPASDAASPAAATDAKSNVALSKFKAGPTDRRPRTGLREGHRWGRIALCVAVAAGCAAAGWLVGRNASGHRDPISRTAPEVAAAAVWLPAHLERLRQARAAERAGDLRTALRLTTELAKSVDLGPQLAAYRATLTTRLSYLNDAEADITMRLRPNISPDASAALNTARAFNFVRWRRFNLAIDAFAAVAQADPGDAFNLLQWAETLRRKGNFPEAIDKFQEAFSRIDPAASPYAEPQREYIAYARRLSLVENGRETELQPELGQRLAAPAPSGYWLLTGAAAALQKGDLPAAVDILEKARAVLSPDHFRVLLDDYFFRSFAHHPEITPFLSPSTPEQQQARLLSMDYFVDP